MPIYEYACRKCGAHVEALQKISDKPLVKCKKCGGRLEKQWSSAGIQFKGSGWYVTDYARKGAGEKPEGTAEGKAEKTEKTEKTETKPDARAETKTEIAKEGGEKKTPKAKSSSKDASTD